MNLFNQKTISRYINPHQPVPPEHLEILGNWKDLIDTDRIKSYKETAFHGEFKSKIVESVLGYVGPGASHHYTVSQEQAILKGSVDLALGRFEGNSGKVIAPLELKDANTDPDAIMPGRAKSPVQQAWEYATHAPGVKWVLVSNYLEIRHYGFGEGTQAYEAFDLSKLTQPAEYARFQLLLGAENLLTGKTADLLAESRREDRNITDALYADYRQLRDSLIFTIREQAPDLDRLTAIAAAQKILDRILFTAFAEDKGLLPDNILEFAYEQGNPLDPKPVWENFKGLFSAINSGNSQLNVSPYNGGLFAPDPLLDSLTLPDEVCEKFRDIGAYDFDSEISVTVLGHIFEQSISDVERLQAIARGEEPEPEKKTGTTGRRKRDGVVYTPDYVARFIVEQTLGAHVREIFSDILARHAQKKVDPTRYETIAWKKKNSEIEAWKAYRERLKRLRIVDPACGSGVFLVMAFDYMKAEVFRVNEKLYDMTGTKDLLDVDSEILTHNLFGVDVNAESVEIAKLSLWVKTARRGKPLDSLDHNLKVGDSLIEDSNYAYLEHGFRWASAFPEVFAEGGFDVVLGNPPYVRQEFLGVMKPYLEKRFEVYHGVADLYCYFFERGLRLLKPGGRLGYISSSTFFKTGSGKPLRDFLHRQARLETVVDFGDIQIFEGVTTYPVILTLRRGEPAKNHQLRFWKIGKLPEANFRAGFEKAAEPYPQSALSTGSWELESPALMALRDKIRGGRKTLKEVYGSPLYGIKTGRNEAFVIDRTTRNRLIAEDPKSADVLKPWLEGKDLKCWRSESRDLWLILFPKGWTIAAFGEGDEEVQWARLEHEFPAIVNHLKPFAEVCRKRTDKGDYWWELRACDYYAAFEKPKIVYQEISNKPQFSYDITNALLANTAYLISSSDYALLAYLNSNTFWFLYKNLSAQIRGGYARFLRQFMDIASVPSDSSQELAALAEACQTAAKERYQLQQALTRRIPDLAQPGRAAKLTTKLKTWWALEDFAAFRAEIKKTFKTDIPLAERNDWEAWLTGDQAKIAALTAEIKACEAQINAAVYALFDLTPAEIELLEANL